MRRLALPPSLVHLLRSEASEEIAHAPPSPITRLADFLQEALGDVVDVVIPRDYDAMRQALLTGAVDAALAPPFVCAQLESESTIQIPWRALRRGSSSYASALVVHKDRGHTLLPRTLRAAWVDPVSVAGHLLPKAWLASTGQGPERFFLEEHFFGDYGAALAAVVAGDADVAAVHVLPADDDSLPIALEAHRPGASRELIALAVTEAVPADGLACRADGEALAKALTSVPHDLLQTLFRADGFVPHTAGGYRVLKGLAG